MHERSTKSGAAKQIKSTSVFVKRRRICRCLAFYLIELFKGRLNNEPLNYTTRLSLPQHKSPSALSYTSYSRIILAYLITQRWLCYTMGLGDSTERKRVKEYRSVAQRWNTTHPLHTLALWQTAKSMQTLGGSWANVTSKMHGWEKWSDRNIQCRYRENKIQLKDKQKNKNFSRKSKQMSAHNNDLGDQNKCPRTTMMFDTNENATRRRLLLLLVWLLMVLQLVCRLN